MNNKITRSNGIQSSSTLNRQKINRHAEMFKNVLQEEIAKDNPIKMSAHALKRLSERNIELSDKDVNALTRGLDKAAMKGSKESLLLYKDIAYVASVKNRTVITAIGQKDTRENVFTNIDSAVIIDEE